MGEDNLKKDFLEMISLFSSGTTGQPLELETSVNLEEVGRFASEQGVWPIVFSVVHKAYQRRDKGKLKIAQATYDDMLKRFFVESAHQIQRQNGLNELYEAFEKQQIGYCILKGESLSHVYHQPSLRISSDTDIYIRKKDQKTVIDILKRLDYQILPLQPNCHHWIAEHPVAGSVEIHVRLYNEFVEEVWFNNKALLQENYRNVKTSEGRWIPTLGMTDQLIFITLHFIKHSIGHGIGIRQLMDILLYMKHYKEVIDWERYDLLLDDLNYKKFVHQLIGIGIVYFGIKADDLPPCNYDVKIMNHIVWDMQRGGIFGKQEQGRAAIFTYYTKARLKRFSERQRATYMRRFRLSQLRLLIPARVHLENKFPYVTAHPYLYPIALLHRIMQLLARIGNGEKRVTQYVLQEKDPFFDKRMELINELEMI